VHATRATYGLYAINAIVVAAAVTVAWIANGSLEWWKAGLGAGFGLPVLIQSKFTLTKPLGDRWCPRPQCPRYRLALAIFEGDIAGVSAHHRACAHSGTV
jgi:hypothetical protein